MTEELKAAYRKSCDTLAVPPTEECIKLVNFISEGMGGKGSGKMNDVSNMNLIFEEAESLNISDEQFVTCFTTAMILTHENR